MPIRIGTYRHRIELQRESTTTNAHNEPVKTWSTIKTIQASITPLRSIERDQAGREVGEVTHIIRTWWRSGIDTTMRVKHGENIYQISGIRVADEIARKEMELEVKAVG